MIKKDTSLCYIALVFFSTQFTMKHGHYVSIQSNHMSMFVLDAQGIKVFPKRFQ